MGGNRIQRQREQFSWRVGMAEELTDVYHHTYPSSVQKILDEGFKGDWRDHVFVTTKPHDPDLRGNEWVGKDRYDSVLELNGVPRSALTPDEVQPKDPAVQWYTVPLSLINSLPRRIYQE